ncbi:MAG: branched-chain amino acid ABC transporter permease [Siculibacillus sp.]
MTSSLVRFAPDRAILVAAVLTAAAVAALVGFAPRVLVSLLTQALIVSFLALGVGVLIRLSGLVTFGHAAPFGLGAYGAAWVLAPNGPFAPEIGLAVVVLGIGLVFWLIGLIVGRVEGIAFGMLTLALGQAVHVAAGKFRHLTGGSDGLIVDLPRRLFGARSDVLQNPYGMLVITAAIMALVLFLLRAFERTRAGRLAVAVRENEERVRFLGYRTRALKALVFALSAALPALGGVLFTLHQGFVSPEVLTWGFSGHALIMAILGGTVALWGPVAGALVFFVLREELGGITTHWLAILGTTLIVVTVVWPTGLAGAAAALKRRLAGSVGQGGAA